MPRFPTAFLADLKQRVACEQVLEARGVDLVRSGSGFSCRCPLPGHDDRTPSFKISVKDGASLWHCFGACATGGDVITLVQRLDDCGFAAAIASLASLAGLALPAPQRSTVRPQAACPIDVAARGQALSRQVADAYHAQLLRPAADGGANACRRYLAGRGLGDDAVIDHFRLGWAERGALGKRLPTKQRAAGAALRAELEALGWFRAESGHEALAGSLVVPLFDDAGAVISAYGRKITRNLRAGTPAHVYLQAGDAGDQRPVFNLHDALAHAPAHDHAVIVCEAIIDALTLWRHGWRNVIAAYGVHGLPAAALPRLHAAGVQRVVIAFDRDDAGDRGAQAVAEAAIAQGLTALRVVLPPGQDVNDLAGAAEDPATALRDLVGSAQWLGGAASVPSPDALPDAPAAAHPSFTSSAAPPPAPADALHGWRVETASNGDVHATSGSRRWRVRGLDRCRPGALQLRVQLRLQLGDAPHQDVIDLAQQRARSAYAKAAAAETGLALDVVRGDLAKLLLIAEDALDQLAARDSAAGATAAAVAQLSDDDRAQGDALLRAPDLLDRIGADLTAGGLVGETVNKVIAYVCATSRLLPRPLAMVVQSSSSAGKSSLLDGVLALMPDDQVHRYASLSGQALYYMAGLDLRHRVLAIAEDQGIDDAAYALKLLISDGSVSRVATTKDPDTGALVSRSFTVTGPTQVCLTTTALDVHDELLNRCLVLAVDEDADQTAAILAAQRRAYTADGLRERAERARIRARHHAAQRLLASLPVVNPYAQRLTFHGRRVEDRRDHRKYLDLINAIALLHQKQRDRVSVPLGDGDDAETADAIVVAPADIAAANRLFTHLYGRPLAEVPAHTVNVLRRVQGVVRERRARGEPESLSRRDIREATGLSLTVLRRHLDRLVEEEFLIPLGAPQRGQVVRYRLEFDDDALIDGRYCPGLIDAAALVGSGACGYDANLAHLDGQLAPPKLPHGSPKAQGWLTDENRENPAMTPETAHSGPDAEKPRIPPAKSKAYPSKTYAPESARLAATILPWPDTPIADQALAYLPTPSAARP